jgi:hypothetical protein
VIKSQQEIKMTDFVEGVRYVPLETNPDALLRGYGDVFLSGQYIFVVEGQNCFQYDRDSGRFIREIGKAGRGPEEYNHFQFLSEKEEALYFTNYNDKLIRYSYDGDFLGGFSLPDYDGVVTTPTAITEFADTLYVSYFLNGWGEEKLLLMIFNGKGEVVKVFPNDKFFEFKGSISVARDMGSFHNYLGDLCFNVWYNDTIFKVGVDSLYPAFVINRGEATPPYDYISWTPEENESRNGGSFIFKSTFVETTRFILIFFKNQIAVYDKESGTLKVMPQVVNDINIPFDRFKYGSLSDKEELSYLIQAGKITTWIDENPGKADSLSRGMEILRRVGQEDNPVVCIVSIRK